MLPRQRRAPRRLDSGSVGHTFDSTTAYFRKQYFEALDAVSGELKNRFQQERGMPVAAALEQMLLNSARGSFSADALPSELHMYRKDVDE